MGILKRAIVSVVVLGALVFGLAAPAAAAPIGPFNQGIFSAQPTTDVIWTNFKSPVGDREIIWAGIFNGVPVQVMRAGEECVWNSGRLCVWQHRDRTGTFDDWGYPSGGKRSLAGSWWNNRISSVQNETGSTVLLIGNVECKREAQGGYVLEVGRGRYIPNLANIDGGYPNDAISCVDFRG